MTSTDSTWDAIVIGSGIGGLSCAAALTKTGHKVLMLEQHSIAGGLTQTFSRHGFTWNVGVHYLGEMEPGGAARSVIDWLADGQIQFTSMGAVYDTVHFPGDFEMQLSRPESALKLDLKEKFPGSEAEIDAVLGALAEAQRAGRAVFAQRAMPALLARIHGLWHRDEIRKWWGRTSAEVLDELVTDARLRSVLLAQRGDYGGTPRESSFGIHATIQFRQICRPDAHKESPMTRLSFYLSILCLGFACSQGANAQQESNAGQAPQPGPEYLTSPATTSLKRPFSEAVRVGNMLYLSGFTGRIPGTNTVVPGGIQAETKQVMENIKGALDRYGSDFDHVVKCTVMLLDIKEWAAMNEVYRTYFPQDRMPARSAFATNGLAFGARVEIECLATMR